jgi:Rieske 2Fe-2S family protein
VEHVSRLKERGSFVTLKFDKIHVLLMRGDNGIKAYHNYCTHRGWCLVEEPCGKRDRHICGYHCWLFDANGDLTAWNGTFLNPSFSPEKAALRPIHTEVRYGMVFISFSQSPPDIDEALGDFAKFAKVYDLASFECVDTRDYSVDCNWKLIIHNINESLHFPATHPYVHRMADYDDARTYDVQGDIISACNRIRKGFNTISLTGKTTRPPLKGIPAGDLDLVNWVTILPNLMFGFCTDYIMLQWAWPVSPSACLVRNHWLFHRNQTAQPDFDCNDVIDMWLKTNDEDWEVCERTQRGIESRYWQPGFLSLDEELVAKIDQWVSDKTAPV